jgi:hypothetical protein
MPIYSITPDVTEVDENDTVVLSISSDAGDGTVLYWTIAGTGVTSSDFTPVANLYGPVTLVGSSASVTGVLRSDSLLEGYEYFIAQLRTDSTSGSIVAVTPTITITDTSTGVPADTDNGMIGAVSNDNSKPAFYVNGNWYKITGTAISLL